LCATLLTGCQDPPASADSGAPDTSYPQWAFPGTTTVSLQGSQAAYSEVQMYDRTMAVDWYPESHPAMPDAVTGRPPTFACGFCHLPQGAGRSENAALAGLPYAYIVQQAQDMRAGLRKSPNPKFGPAMNMQTTIKQVSDADIQDAARYFSSLTFKKHLKIVESDTVPRFTADAFVWVIDTRGDRQPLGQRIIEGPDDFEGFERRDPNMTFTAYVPTGAIADGEYLAAGKGSRPACASCHGVGLKGGQIGPPIAGRLPTYIFRQLYAIKSGTRRGADAVARMKPIVDGLSQKDMVDLAAYVASLDP